MCEGRPRKHVSQLEGESQDRDYDGSSYYKITWM
jgi:hypothetical protein